MKLLIPSILLIFFFYSQTHGASDDLSDVLEDNLEDNLEDSLETKPAPVWWAKIAPATVVPEFTIFGLGVIKGEVPIEAFATDKVAGGYQLTVLVEGKLNRPGWELFSATKGVSRSKFGKDTYYFRVPVSKKLTLLDLIAYDRLGHSEKERLLIHFIGEK